MTFHVCLYIQYNTFLFSTLFCCSSPIPTVPLAALKNEYGSCGSHDICEDWFHYETHGCNILKSTLDKLVYKYFGDGNTIKFQPPILLDGAPSTTYFRLEYGGESPACDGGNCRGPHYCSEEVALLVLFVTTSQAISAPTSTPAKTRASTAIRTLPSRHSSCGSPTSACPRNVPPLGSTLPMDKAMPRRTIRRRPSPGARWRITWIPCPSPRFLMLGRTRTNPASSPPSRRSIPRMSV